MLFFLQEIFLKAGKGKKRARPGGEKETTFEVGK